MDKEPALVTSFDELKKKNESHYMAAARKRLALTAVLIFLVIPALIATVHATFSSDFSDDYGTVLHDI